ncbi:MAG: 3'-5' exonuclease [Deltaproteobacteria bacterium]|nr:3'-5' exonuclease [Deltaproteobacteria bacterium]
MPNWTELPLVGLDTETTGLSLTDDRVFEVALVTYQGGEQAEAWTHMLDPLKPLSAESSEKTGVTNADLAGKPAFASVAGEVVDRLADRVVVGYNILGFDLPLLENELKRVGLALPRCWPVDVLVFARELIRGGRHNLGEMVKHYGITMDTAHRAAADADASVRLLLAMARDLPSDLDALTRLQAQWRDSQRARKAVWRQKSDDRGGGDALLHQEVAPSASFVDEQGRISLGPTYVYGRETDPLRSFLLTYCNATARATASIGDAAAPSAGAAAPVADPA